MADIALASQAGGSDQKDSVLTGDGPGAPPIQNNSGLTQGLTDRPVTG